MATVLDSDIYEGKSGKPLLSPEIKIIVEFLGSTYLFCIKFTGIKSGSNKNLIHIAGDEQILFCFAKIKTFDTLLHLVITLFISS